MKNQIKTLKNFITKHTKISLAVFTLLTITALTTAFAVVGLTTFTSGSQSVNLGSSIPLDNEPTHTISNNTASGNGGAIYNEGTININTDVAIDTNSAIDGGAILNTSTGTVTMNKGVISNNFASNSGAGIYNAGSFTMDNGIITNNGADSLGNTTINGGGIAGFTNSVININGGEISYNKSHKGGGIFNDITLTINDGVNINNNTALNEGGGIYTDGTTTIHGANIDNNNAVTGAGLSLSNGNTLHLYGTNFNSNIASHNGGGLSLTGTIVADGITLKDNTAVNSGAGLITWENSVCTISNSLVDNCDVEGYGGGVYNKGEITLTNTDIINCDSPEVAGGLYIQTGSGIAEDCYIGYNTSVNGSGGGVYVKAGCSLTLNRCDISNNSANVCGGIASRGTINITSSDIHHNSANDQAGVTIVSDTGIGTISNSNIYNNIANKAGSAISVHTNADINMDNCRIYNNTVTNGNATLYLYGDSHNISSTEIYNNSSIQQAISVGTDASAELNSINIHDNIMQAVGAIGNFGTMTINDSIIDNNTSTLQIGAIANKGILEINDTTISNNNTPKNGAGIYSIGGTATLNNTHIINNTSDSIAGGAYINAGTFTLNNSTVSDNSSTQGGGLYINPNATVNIINTEIDSNTATENIGSGIYHNGTLNIKGSSVINKDNQEVYLVSDDKFITVTGELTEDFVARITPNTYTKGRTLVRNAYTEGQTPNSSYNMSKFTMTPQDPYITEAGDLIVDTEGILDTDLVIWQIGEKYIYVDGVNGNDSNNGLTPTTPVKTFKQAYTNMGKYYGTIYVVDTVTLNESITLDKSYYTDDTSTINLTEESGVDIKRYSKPTVVNAGFEKDSNANNLINVINGNTLTLENITIDGHSNELVSDNANIAALGTTGKSLVRVTDSTLDINGATLQNNTTPENGGAIYTYGTSTVDMSSGTITGNTAVNGGAIYISSNGTFNFSEGTITNNTATNGGAIYNLGTLEMIAPQTPLSYNIATASGGVIYNDGLANIGGTEMEFNTANDGGAIYNRNGNLTIYECNISNNTATNSVGAIYNDSNQGVEIIRSSVYYNQAKLSGAIGSTSGNINIVQCDISYNSSTESAGAIISNDDGTTSVIIDSSTLSYNEAGTLGGAGYFEGYLEIKDSTISNNKALNGTAGAIRHTKGKLVIESTELSSNESTGSGGAIYATKSEVSISHNSKFESNKSLNSGGGAMYINEPTYLAVYDTIFDSNKSKLDGGAFHVYGAQGIYMLRINVNNNESGRIAGGVSLNDLAGTATITDSIITNNKALQAAGLCNNTTDQTAAPNPNSILELINTTISGNKTSYGVGAMTNTSKALLKGCTIENNIDSARMAGAILNAQFAELTIEDTDIINNKCVTLGGGIYNLGGKVTFISGNISSNTAGTDGGGIWNSGTLELIGGKISANKAQNGAGIFNTNTGNIVMLKSYESLEVSSTLEENDWETIQQIVSAGKTAEAGWKVGDTKTVTINSEEKVATLIGTNHDGENTATFMIMSNIGSHNMNSESNEYPHGDNIGGWRDSELRAWLNSEIYNSMSNKKTD